MKEIKRIVRYDDYNNVAFYKKFRVVDNPNEIGEILECREVKVYDEHDGEYYKYFKAKVEDEFEIKETVYFCIDCEADKDIEVKYSGRVLQIYVSDKYCDPVTEEYDSRHFRFDLDGIEFDDENEMDEYLREEIVQKIEEWFCLSDDDWCKIYYDCKIYMENLIKEEN